MRKDNKISTSLVQLIETGLKLWIKSKCSFASQIELKINASILELISGKIKGASLTAKDIEFQKIYISNLSLISDRINIKLSLLKNKDKINIENQFKIKGFIALRGEKLYTTITSTKWNFLRNLIETKLLKSKKLDSIWIKGDKIVITTKRKESNSNEYQFDVKANSETIHIYNKDSEVEALIPMDKEIKVKNVNIDSGDLIISGESTVSP